MAQEAENLLQDPVVLALAVLMDRVRGLPKEERDNLLKTARAMWELLTHEDREARKPDAPEDGDGLLKWMAYAGSRIKQAREKLGLTQVDLAAKAGIPAGSLSRMEAGRQSPTDIAIEKLAAALGLDLSAFDASS